jgi:uncharacterized repeat protein (TIGR03803 family)
MSRLFTMPLLAVVASFAAPYAQARTAISLYTFPNRAKGIVPYAPVTVLADGALAGTAYYGGNNGCQGLETPGGCGTVFELTKRTDGSWKDTKLHVFEPKTGDGASPVARVITDAAGNLYGTTQSGGACAVQKRGCGVVFKLTPPSHGGTNWHETVLYRFAGGADGDDPEASLVLDSAGNLYGTTAGGGANHTGIVFRLSPGQDGAYTETVLASLGAKTGNSYAPLLIGNDGALYGTTSSVFNSTAEIFKVAPPTGGGTSWTLTPIYSLPATNTLNYLSGLVADANGNLYGTNGYAGNYDTCFEPQFGCGLVYRLQPPAIGSTSWTETDLYVFSGAGRTSSNPFGGVLVGADGTLTGTTLNGGVGAGTMFQLKPTKSGRYTFTTIAQFRGPRRGGTNPSTALAVDSAGNFYGTTNESEGSAFPPYGTVYEVTP